MNSAVRSVKPLFIVLLVAILCLPTISAQEHRTSYAAALRAIAHKAAMRTTVPLRLPLGARALNEHGAIYFQIIQATPEGYEIRVSSEKNCDYMACLYGSFKGSLHSDRDNRATTDGALVALANGLQGRFYKQQCGASCGEAQLYWTQDGVYYCFTGKAYNRAELIAMANIAIRSAAIIPAPPARR